MLKQYLGLFFATVALLVGGVTQAESSYPSKPIRIVVPFGAGSSTDIFARTVAKGLTEKLGEAVIVENRAGAGGNIGSAAVVNAQPDGYTIIMGTNGPFAANVSVYSDLPYDPVQDFEPIALMGQLPMVLIAHPDKPASDLNELIAEAKANPGTLNFGASNTTARVWVELLKDMADIEVETVLYANVGSMLTDLMAGRISYAFENVGASLSALQSHQVKPLAVTTPKRAKFAPDVQTVAESGLDEHELVVWFAMFAPKDTPPEIVERLNIALNELLETEEVLRTAEQISLEPVGGTPEDLAKYHVAEVEKWRDLIEMTGIRIN